jgi:hypothetical protein
MTCNSGFGCAGAPAWRWPRADPIHRHNAQAFVYVLEGSIVMQVKGGKEVTLTPGQTFYEGRDDVHLVAGMRAVPSRQSSWCSWSRTRALRCWYLCRNESARTATQTASTSRRSSVLLQMRRLIVTNIRSDTKIVVIGGSGHERIAFRSEETGDD